MPLENHEKARFLLHRSLVEGISLEDRHWLDAHVGQCAQCGRYADLSARAVRALDWFALELDPAAALRVENVVRSRAEGMRSAEAHAKSLWIGTAVAIFLTLTDLPLCGALWHGWPVNGISPAAYGRSYSRRSGCCHPFYSRCCRFFEEGFWERIPIATDKLYELAQRIRSHSSSGQNRGRFSLRAFLFRDLRGVSGERPRDVDGSGGWYAWRRLLSSRRLYLLRRRAARYAADSLGGTRGARSELHGVRALLPVAKADPPSVSQLRARSCTRCRVLSPLWPTANEHGTATLTGRILKNEPSDLGART